MRPLRRILSISDCDLQTIDILECTKRLSGHRFHWLIAIDFDQSAAGAVIIHQRQSELLVGLKALRDDLFRIVPALRQWGAVTITNALDFGRLEIDVVNQPAGGTRTTSGKPLQQLIILDYKANHNRWRTGLPARRILAYAHLFQLSVQPLGLPHGARKAVQNKSTNTIGLRQPIRYHVADQFVGNQVAALHDALGF